MPLLKLHLKTALLASAVALVLLVISFLIIAASIASRIQTEQEKLAQLQAEKLAESLSLFPEQTNADNLQQLTNFVSGIRPNLETARIWKLENNDFVEQAASDDSLPSETIPLETKNALLSNSESQIVSSQAPDSNDSLFRIFAPVVVKNKVSGAVEVVERLDTVSSIAMRYVANLIWIALATIILM